jgi:2-haloacid dehalogenase
VSTERPAIGWVLFDMNGTLLDPSDIAEALRGAEDRPLVTEAFDEALLHSMAETLSGGYRPLPDFVRAALERRLLVAGRDTAALDEAMARASRLPAYPDAEEAIHRLVAAGLQIGVLTNSTTDSAEQSLRAAGLRDRLSAVIGSDRARVFKPHPRVYQHGAEELGLYPSKICMVAAHGWDLMGAGRVGMRTVWISRKEGRLPAVIPDPDICAADLAEAATVIVDRFAAIARGAE